MPALPPPCRDMSLLLPAFEPKVREVLEALTARGFTPKVHETWRSPERAAALLRKGSTKNGKLSMHCFGAATDLICAEHAWDCAEHGCGFFQALGEESYRAGLTWGGDWDYNPATPQKLSDSPHIQAIPLSRQDAFRALPTLKRNQYLIDYFARRN